MAALATKFDALYGEVREIAKTHKVTEVEMNRVITNAFHMLLKHYMTEYMNFVNSPLWYERYSIQIGFMPIDLKFDP